VKGLTAPSQPGGRPGFLSDVIVELGMVEASTVEDAVNAARVPGRTVARILVETGALTEDQLARAIGERYGIDHVDLDAFQVDPAAANLITPSAAKRYKAVPVAFAPDGALIVAMADPADSLAINDIAVMTKLAVRPAVASAPQIDQLRARLPLPAKPGKEGGPKPGAPAAGRKGDGAAPKDKPAPKPATPGLSGPAVAPEQAERSTAVLWQADGDGAQSPAPAAAPAQPGAPAQAPAAGDPAAARKAAAELKRKLEAEHGRALEELREEYESKLRGQERAAGELREVLEAEKAARERAVGKVRDELEAEKSQLESTLRALQSSFEEERVATERAGRDLRAKL
jgi:hypothetical protein